MAWYRTADIISIIDIESQKIPVSFWNRSIDKLLVLCIDEIQETTC